VTEWDAAAYARQSSLQAAMAEEELAALDLVGDERVLDLGCGDGRISAAIARRVPRGSVVGVDPSSHMIEFARTRFPAEKSPNLSFEVGDARALAFRAEFDLVVSFNALHWVLRADQALRSIRAALRPAGRAILRFVSGGGRTSLEDVIEMVRAEPRWAPAFAGFVRPYVHPLPEEYARLCVAAGLRVVHEEVRDERWDFGSREAFVAFCRATFVEWTQHLPEGEHDAFIAEVLDRYRAVAVPAPGDENAFRFLQMEVVLAPAEGS
jgi:trans-aconitate methyltransferase